MTDTVYQIVAQAQALRARLAWLEQHGIREHEREPLRRVRTDVSAALAALERLAVGYPRHHYERAEKGGAGERGRAAMAAPCICAVCGRREEDFEEDAPWASDDDGEAYCPLCAGFEAKRKEGGRR